MKSSYSGVPVPSNGKAIVYSDGVFQVPDTSDDSVHRGRRNGARYLEGVAAGF